MMNLFPTLSRLHDVCDGILSDHGYDESLSALSRLHDVCDGILSGHGYDESLSHPFMIT